VLPTLSVSVLLVEDEGTVGELHSRA